MLNEPYPPDSAQEPPPQPAVWPWFVTYCGLLALLYLVLVIMFTIPLFLSDAQLMEIDDEESPLLIRVTCGIMVGISLPFFAVFAAAPFLPKRPWVWVVDIVLIAFSMSSLCCLPFGIPLLIYWLRDDVQAYFGKAPRPRPLAQRPY